MLLKDKRDFASKDIIKNQTKAGPQEKFKVNMLNPVKISSKPKSNIIINSNKQFLFISLLKGLSSGHWINVHVEFISIKRNTGNHV